MPLRLARKGAAFAPRLPFPHNRRYFNFLENFPGVACADTDNPNDYAAWSAAAAATAGQGYFGPIWTWVASICAEWPFADADRYTGPFTATTANPLLVIGNDFDPATPYAGAPGGGLDDARRAPAHRPRLGPHVAVPVGLRRRGRGPLPDRSAAAARGAQCSQDHVPFS